MPRDRVRAEAHRLLTAGVSGHVFPGGVACVAWGDGRGGVEHVVACAGEIQRGGPKVAERTRYDLGALTQAFVATAALRMQSREGLDLDVPVETMVSDVRGGVLTDMTVRALFLHRGGLAEWGGLYLDVPHDSGSAAARRWILSEAARRPGLEPAGAMERSDLGYIIAGEAIARAGGVGLDELLDRTVLEPLGLRDELVYPGALPSERRAALVRETAPTERCPWRGKLVRGQVHDENAVALGGVSGHAGLFGTARGVATLGRAALDALAGRGDFLSREAMERALAAPEDGGHLRFGWELRYGTPPVCGRRMGPNAFGKVGFTGTSLFCDPDHDVVVVLLTNRLCPSRANEKIDGFRPAFHDGVMAALGA